MELVKRVASFAYKIYGHLVTRQLQRFNVDERAHKLLDKQQEIPKAAPTFPAQRQMMDRIAREHPEILEEIKSNPKDLLDNLKKIRVSSTDDESNQFSERDQSKLPKMTKSQPYPDFGMAEPDVIPKGMLTVRQAIEIISNHKKEPEKWNTKSLAQFYSLDEKNLFAVLDHFKAFQVFQRRKEDQVKIPWYDGARIQNAIVGHSYEAYVAQRQMDEEQEKLDEAKATSSDKPKADSKPVDEKSSIRK